MKERFAAWLRGLADWIEAAPEVARSDPSMFLRSERPELSSPVIPPISDHGLPAFVEQHDFDEYDYWPTVRGSGGMYL